MSGFNFCQLPVVNGTAFFNISKKEDNLARYTQIFKIFYPEVFFPFNFAPGISRIFFDAVSKFSKVLVEYMESALRMLTICVEKLVILGRTQMEWFILVDVPFVYNYQCQANSGKTAMSKMDISGDESLQVQNHL